MPRLSLAVALGVGSGGSLVDVSSYARLTDGVSRRWGRDDQYYGAEPGQFSFVLDNADGRFTPGNAGSPLATTVVEGMAASLQVGSRVSAGRVRTIEPDFPSGDAAWARVRVTCDDVLGVASRVQLSDAWDQLVDVAGPIGYWKFDEPEDSTQASDSGPLQLRSFIPFEDHSIPLFGADPLPGIGETQARFNAINLSGSSVGDQYNAGLRFPDFEYPAGSGGAYGFWVTPTVSEVGGLRLFMTLRNGLQPNICIQGTGGLRASVVFGIGTGTDMATLQIGVPTYLSMVIDVVGADVRARLYQDGVLQGAALTPSAATTSADLSPRAVTIFHLSTVGDPTDYTISRVTHTYNRVEEQLLTDTATETELLTLIESMAPTVAFDTFPTELSDLPTVNPSFSGLSVLDALNDVMLIEQGNVYAQTTGTLLSPTETVKVRERHRPTAVTCSFDAVDELANAPQFVRDITNLVSSVQLSNGDTSVTVTNTDLVPRAGGATASESLLLERFIDMRTWGEDRLYRGSAVDLNAVSVVVDAMTTPTDRSADLLALLPGDRVQITNLPDTVLGFDTWDGWFLGATETHNISEHSFELMLQPCTPDPGLFDTARFMADGELTLVSNINSAVTSLSIQTTGVRLSTTEEPYTIQLDDEQMTVTVCTSATPQVLTVTRGVNGTTAAAHTSGAVLVSVPDSIFGY